MGMKRLLTVTGILAALAGCAADPQRNISAGMSESEVSSQLGKPVAIGRLPSGEEYWDYSRQPFGYTISRVTFTADGRVREVRNLLTEDNFKNLRVGMTPDEVAAVVGPSAPSERRVYAGGTKSWVYRYYDLGVTKLLNVIFGADNRVLTHYTEWDPSVYSRGDGSRSKGGK
jgi:outer membrane protein assembly factor BamE (lipoprotein component of BamABCDE complex)